MCVENCRTKLNFGATILLALFSASSVTQAKTSIGKGGEARTPDPAAASGGPVLDGTPIDVTRCPTDPSRTTHRCSDVLGFAITETRSDLSNFRFVEQTAQNFQVFLEPPSCDVAKHDAEIEVRRYEGRPFALIQRVECRNASTQKISAFHVVRGLPGFEALSSNIEAANAGARARAVAEAKAQQRADDYLLTLWPVLRANLKKEHDRAIEEAFAARIEAQRAERRKQERAGAAITGDEPAQSKAEEEVLDERDTADATAGTPDDKEIVVIINVGK